MSYYLCINEEAYLENGEIIFEGSPISFYEVLQKEDEVMEREPYTYYGVHHMKEFYELINALGGKRGEFISYLINNKNTWNQISNRSQSELAKEAGVSMQTATDAINLLREHGLIKASTRNFMINPFLDRRGDRKRETVLMNLYGEFIERGKKPLAEKKNDEKPQKSLDN